MANKVQLTIVVPNYNKEKYLKECLDSVQCLTFKDFECIIVDDGSTDNSKDIILEFCKDRRFHAFYNLNHGVAYSRNFAILKAKGKYILPLDSDDCIERTYLDRALYCFEHNDITVFYGKWFFIGDDYMQWNNKFGNLLYSSYRNLLISNSIHNSCIYKKADAIACGLYDENLKGFEDWEFLIRLLYKEKYVAFDKQISYYYRREKSSRNVDDNANMTLRIADIRKANFNIYKEYNLI